MAQTVVIPCMCSHQAQLFGLLFERVPAGWTSRHSVRTGDGPSDVNGYEAITQNQLTVKISPIIWNPDAFICPYCAAPETVRCGWCFNFSCTTPHTQSWICPWCRQQGNIDRSGGASAFNQIEIGGVAGPDMTPEFLLESGGSRPQLGPAFTTDHLTQTFRGDAQIRR